MNKYIVTFGFNGDDGYQVANSKPIEAPDDQQASIMLKDQFETFEGIECTIITVKKV